MTDSIIKTHYEIQIKFADGRWYTQSIEDTMDEALKHEKKYHYQTRILRTESVVAWERL